MQFFENFKRRRLEKKFEKYDLSIIKSISKDTFHRIIQELSNRGWEVSVDYVDPNGWDEKGECKVRKGISVLNFAWTSSEKGSITGVDRIVSGLATEFDLVKRNTPF